MSHSQPPTPPQSNHAIDLTLPTEVYRQLRCALSPRQMARYFQEWQGTPPTPPAPKTPVCRVLDMKYAPEEQCTLLYQWGEALIIGQIQWRGGAAPVSNAHWVAPLGMWLYEFSHDPALPGLQTVLNSPALATALHAVLPTCQAGEAQLVGCRATPLRYRPGKRCTIQLDLQLRQRVTGHFRTQRLYGKLYHQAAKASAVYNEMHLLTRALAGSNGVLQVAGAVAFLPELGLVLQAPVTGAPLDLLLNHPARLHGRGQARLGEGVARTAHALAELHQIGLATDRLRPPTTDLAKLSRRAAKVATVAPALGAHMAALAARLSAQAPHLGVWEAALSVGHGDCKPSQFFLAADHVALLDFDHCGMADPAADVGLFLATLRQIGVRLQTKATYRRTGATWAPTALETAFLQAYLPQSGASAHFRERVAWYETLALLRKAWRGFARSPWSPLPAMLVEEAWRGV